MRGQTPKRPVILPPTHPCLSSPRSSAEFNGCLTHADNSSGCKAEATLERTRTHASVHITPKHIVYCFDNIETNIGTFKYL